MKDVRRLHRSQSGLPQRSYPFPNIDKLVDDYIDYQILSFMDAYFTYNQIPMHEADRDKTAFMA